MKRVIAALLCGLALFSLTACASEKPEVEYYLSRRQIEHSTGDVNLTVNEYDDAWRMLSAKTYLNGEISSEQEYIYSEDEGLMSVKTNSALYGESISEYRQEFDTEGRLSKSVAYNDGALVASTEFSYDSEGRTLEVKSFDADGNAYSTLTNEYDSKGNLISYTVKTAYYSSRQEHTYDKYERISRTEMFKNDELESYIEFTGDKNSRQGCVYSADGKVTGTTNVLYDDAGNVLMEENYDAHSTLTMRTCCEYIGTDGSVSSGIN